MALAQKVGSFETLLLKKRTFTFRFSVVSRSLPELKAYPPTAKQPGRQLKDLDVRQHQPQGGVLRGDPQLSQICHQSEPVQHWHCHQEDKVVLTKKATSSVLDGHTYSTCTKDVQQTHISFLENSNTPE